jgi:branched-chain amino acid transport system substrate-binding protein
MKRKMHIKISCLLVSMMMLCTIASTAYSQDSMYIPIPSYRVGPYAAGGTGYYGGILDYYMLLNERDGGVGGVKLTWSECETEYSVERGVECYKRMKDREGGSIFFDPLSVGIAMALNEVVRADQIPMITVNHGMSETIDGEVFPYGFPLGMGVPDEYNATVRFMAHLESGDDPNTVDISAALSGKKIVTLYHGSPYGKEALDYMDAMGEEYGFEHHRIEVPHPGNEQQSQWIKIRKLKPDFVFLRGWGVMNPVAMQTASRMGFPVSRLIGNIWSNSDEDVIPAGDAANGYQAITTHPAGIFTDVQNEIISTLYDSGKGDLEDKSRLGSVYHNLGITAGIMHVEAIINAQKRWGEGKALSAQQIRWGFENIRFDEARIAELGAEGLLAPMLVTCKDHVGGHNSKFQKWDAKARQWNIVTPWIRSQAPTEALYASAEKYRADNDIEKRSCDNDGDRDNWNLAGDQPSVPAGASTWN